MGDLARVYGGSTSSVSSSFHIYDAWLLTPPRQCTHKMRISTHSFPFGGRPLASIGISSLKIMTYPCTLALAPFIPTPPLLRKPLKTPPYAPQTIASFSLPALQATLGYMYVLTRSRPTVARAPSRESGITSAPAIHEGTIVPSVRVGFKDAQNEGGGIDQTRRLFCHDPVYGSMHSGQGIVVGEFGRVLVEGGGWWKCPELCGHPRPAGLEICHPRVGYGTSMGRDSPRRSSHLTD